MAPKSENEVGIAFPRARPRRSREDVEHFLSEKLDSSISLPENAIVTGAPESCPACGSAQVMWGCDEEQERTREEIHPLVWHAEAWMADSYICRDCDAGWIEPDDP